MGLIFMQYAALQHYNKLVKIFVSNRPVTLKQICIVTVYCSMYVRRIYIMIFFY